MHTIVTIIKIKTMGITPNRTNSIGLTFFGPSVDFSIMFPSTGITEKEGVGGEV